MTATQELIADVQKQLAHHKHHSFFERDWRVADNLKALLDHIEYLSAEVERLTAEADDHEVELDEAARGPWAVWSLAIMKSVRERSGYDGFDDQDGVDLPAEVEEAFLELERLIERRTAERDQLRAQLEAQGEAVAKLSVEHVYAEYENSAKEDKVGYLSTRLRSIAGVEKLPIGEYLLYTNPAPAAPVVVELTPEQIEWIARGLIAEGKWSNQNFAQEVIAALHPTQPKGEKA